MVKRFRKRIPKKYIEIKTNKKGWTKVELLGFTKSRKRIIVKFKDDTIATLLPKRVRWCVVRITGAGKPNKKTAKQYKSKKKRKKSKNTGRKKSNLKMLKEGARAKLERE